MKTLESNMYPVSFSCFTPTLFSKAVLAGRGVTHVHQRFGNIYPSNSWWQHFAELHRQEILQCVQKCYSTNCSGFNDLTFEVHLCKCFELAQTNSKFWYVELKVSLNASSQLVNLPFLKTSQQNRKVARTKRDSSIQFINFNCKFVLYALYLEIEWVAKWNEPRGLDG